MSLTAASSLQQQDRTSSKAGDGTQIYFGKKHGCRLEQAAARVSWLTCRQTGCGGRGAGGRGVCGYCCCRFSGGGASRGGGGNKGQGPRRQRLAPLQQLLVLLLAEARRHLSGRVALLERSLKLLLLLCCLWLTSRRGTLAISTALGCRRDSSGLAVGCRRGWRRRRRRRGRVELGRVWHC